MFILQLNCDMMYEGFYTTPICVSESHEKLLAIRAKIIEELIIRDSGVAEIENTLEAKYMPLRENKYRRTDEEMINLKSEVAKFIDENCPTLKELNMVKFSKYNAEQDEYVIDAIKCF